MQNTSNRFYSSLGLLILLNVIIKPLWIFGIDRQVQNAVGTVAYGTYFSLFNLSVVLSFLLDWGLTAYVNRQMASSDNTILNNAGPFLWLKCFFALLYAAIVCGVAFFSGIERWDIVAGVIVIQLLTSLFVFLRAIITAQQWFYTDAWLSILDKTLMIIFCGSFLFFPVLFGGISIEKFIMVQVLSTSLGVICAFLILLSGKLLIKEKFRFSFFGKGFLLSALPYAMIVLLMSVHFRLDGFLLERIHPDGAHEAGVYAGAYRLLDAANMAAILFSSFLLPFIAKQFSNNEPITPVILNIRHFIIAFAIGVSSIGLFFAPWIQATLYHNDSGHAAEVLQWCLPALIGYTLVNLYGTVLTATGHINLFCLITLFAVIINLVLNLILIPTYGAKGCSIAALVSQSLCGIACLYGVKYKLGVSLHRSSLVIYIFIAISLGVIFYGGQHYTTISNVSLLAIGAIVSIGIMVFTGLFKPSSWRILLGKPALKIKSS